MIIANLLPLSAESERMQDLRAVLMGRSKIYIFDFKVTGPSKPAGISGCPSKR